MNNTVHPSTTVLLLLAVVAILPGMYAAWVSARTRRDLASKDQGAVGVELTRVGAELLQEEIAALRTERAQWTGERLQWTAERERWHHERTQFSARLEELQFAIHRLALVLEQHQIPIPSSVMGLVNTDLHP